MGESGGRQQYADARVTSAGQLPKFADQQITPPKAPPLEQPKIKMPDPTIEVQKDLKMGEQQYAECYDPRSTLPGPMSMGSGSGTGFGAGNGSGLGRLGAATSAVDCGMWAAEYFRAGADSSKFSRKFGEEAAR